MQPVWLSKRREKEASQKWRARDLEVEIAE